MAPRPGRASCRCMIACCWRKNASAPESSAMSRTLCFMAASLIVALAVDIEWKNDVNHIGIAPIFSELDRYFAPLGLLGRFRTRPGIEQCQFRHPFRRMARNFKGDVAAHRQADERKTVRHGAQDTLCNRGHAVITGVVCDGNRTE